VLTKPFLVTSVTNLLSDISGEIKEEEEEEEEDEEEEDEEEEEEN